MSPYFLTEAQEKGEYNISEKKHPKTISLCSPGWPGTHYGDYTGLELTEIQLL